MRPVSSFIATTVVATATAFAQSAATEINAIDAQPLGQALDTWARQTGLQVIYGTDLIKGRQSPGARAGSAPKDALAQILAGSDLVVTWLNERTVSITAPKRTGDVDPSSTSEKKVAALDEVIVTGSHIRGSVAVGSPVVVVDRMEIERAGYSTARQVLQSLPQNYGSGPTEDTSASIALGSQGASLNSTYGSGVNLRGLGPFSTLVLINGRRVARSGRAGSFFDVSLVPFAAIERVEVLTDGASSIYGSDAISGVVNFILRKDFSGAETGAAYGSVTDGNLAERRISHAQGFTWSGGSLLATAEFFDRDNLAASDRPVYTDDLRRFGGPDLRSSSCNPGNIVGDNAVFAIPAGQDGTALTPGQLIPGQTNRCDRRAGTDALPHQQQFSAFVNAHQELAAGVSVFAEAMYARRAFALRNPGIGLVDTLTVPATNPGYVNPFGGADLPVQVQYSFNEDLGPPLERGFAKSRTATLGADFDLPADWSAEGYATYSDSQGWLSRENAVNTFYLDQRLASSDPSAAFNPFGDGSSSPANALAAIRGYALFDERYKQWQGSAKLDGPLFALPGGDVRLAIGGEYRREQYTFDSLSYVSTPAPDPGGIPQQDRNIAAAFFELAVPLIGASNAMSGARELALSLSARTEDYSDFGRTSDPKIGVSWVPVEGLRARGSYGTSFRAPTLDDTRGDAGGAAYFVVDLPNGAGAGGTTSTLALFGRNPQLQPEEGKSWTAGLDLSPPALPGFTAGLTYFSITYSDKISDLSEFFGQALTNPALASVIRNNPSQQEIDALVATPFFFGSPPTPGSVGAIADLRISNLSVERQRGFDLDLEYRFDLAAGQLNAGLAMTHVLEDTQQISGNSPAADVSGTIAGPIDWRMRARFGWDRGPLGAMLFVTYVNDYSNTNTTPVTHVSSWTTADLNVFFSPTQRGWLSGTRVSMNVQNVFDRSPPLALSAQGGFYPLAFDPQNANALGRYMSLDFRKRW